MIRLEHKSGGVAPGGSSLDPPEARKRSDQPKSRQQAPVTKDTPAIKELHDKMDDFD